MAPKLHHTLVVPADDKMLQQRSKKCCQTCLNPPRFQQFFFVLIALSLPSALASGALGTRGSVPVEKLDFTVDTSLGGNVQGFVRYNDGNDSTMCDSARHFNDFVADLLCKYSGFPGGGYRLDPLPALVNTDVSNLGNLDSIFCPPNAKGLAQCVSGDFLKNPECPHSDIVYLRCYGPGGIRLVGSPADSQAEGWVQLFFDGSWWNVCSILFKREPSNVETVCRLLGFPKNETANFTWVPASTFDPTMTRKADKFLLLPYLGCKGKNIVLADCIVDSKPIDVTDSNKSCMDNENAGAVACRYNEAVKKAPSPVVASTSAAAPGPPAVDASARAPSPVPKPPAKSKGSDFALGAIIGIVVGVVLLIIGLAICCYKFVYTPKRTDVEKGGAAQGRTEAPKVASTFRKS